MTHKNLYLLLCYCSSQPAFAEDVWQLSDMVVTAPALDADKNYATPTATTATRLPIPVRDVPQSIEIRTKQLLTDFGGTQRIDEVAKTVAGVNVIWSGNGGTNMPFLNIRGFSNSGSFPNNGDILKDGYRKLGFVHSNMDNASIEQIEFLKGPSSILFGKTDSLGGAINFISKRPQPKQSQHIDFTAGSFDFYRGSLDVGTPLNTDKTALLRLNAAIEDGDSFRDFANHQVQHIAPAFSFKFNDSNRFTALLDYTHTSMRGDFGIPITPEFAKVPIQRYVQNPNFDHTNTWTVNSLFEFEHDFNADWTLTTGISTSWTDWSQRYTRPAVLDKINTPLIASREPNSEHTGRFNRDIELRLQGRSQIMDMDHQLLLGMGYIENDRDSNNYRSAKTSTFDLLNPNYDQVISWNNVPSGSAIGRNRIYTGYAQDLISILPQLKILLGVRYDNARQFTEKNHFFGLSAEDTQTDARFSPRYGIIYQPFTDTSVYASYTTSFAQRINNKLDPLRRYKSEIGEQYEVGIKQAINQRFAMTLAIYQLTRQNVVLTDVRIQDASVQTGEQQSQGIEIGAIGELTEQLRLTAAYSWMTAQVTKDNKLPIGTKRVGVPDHSFNLFGVYSFTGKLQGLELGSGINYNSVTEATMPNTFKLPETLQWDAMLNYRINPHYKIQLNIKNITDHRNYAATADFGYITFGTPRSAYVTVSADF